MNLRPHLHRAARAACLLSLLTACGARPKDDTFVTANGCAFEADGAGAGTVCALRPSALAPGTSDDFGYHAVAVPRNVGPSTPVYVHLVGSYGDPAKPDSRQFPNLVILQEALAAGYLVLMPAYDNEPTVGSLCDDDLDCHEPVRLEILTGADARAPYANLKRVVAPDDVDSRLRALVAALKKSPLLAGGVPMALSGGELDWARVRVGGHSQGGGHAGVLARHRMVARACMLSAPLDGTRSGTPSTWVTAGGMATPRERLRGVIHEEDPGYLKGAASYAALGMQEGIHWRRLTDATSSPHAFTVKADAPSAVAARAWACFSD
jgi:hypothetical protein